VRSSVEKTLSVHVKTLQRRRSPRIPWGFGSESSGEDYRMERSRAIRSHSEILSAIRSDMSCTSFTIRKRQGEIPKGGLTHRGFTYQESRKPMHCGIEKLETPTSGKTAITGIMVIWARSLARRASV
jgi:hypothetical protein